MNIRNALVFESLTKTALGSLATLYVARQLDAVTFGVLSYYIALFSVISTISLMGMDSLLIARARSLKLSLTDHVLLSVKLRCIFLIAVSVCYAVIFSDDNINIPTLMLLGAVILNCASHLDAQLIIVGDFKFLLKVKIVESVGATILKLVFAKLFSNAAIIIFAYVVPQMLRGAVVFARYIRISRPRYRRLQAFALLRESWPLGISAVAAILYGRSDQLMLHWFGRSEELGNYSLAVLLTEALITSASLLASIRIAQREPNYDETKLSRLLALHYREFFYLGFVAALVSVAAAYLIGEILLTDYSQLAGLVVIMGGALPFTFLSIISSRHFIFERKQALVMRRTLGGLALNVMLNLILIAEYGAFGCAASTIISQIFVSIIADFSHSDARKHFYYKLRGITGKV